MASTKKPRKARAASTDRSGPKTTRPSSSSRRDVEAPAPVPKGGRVMDAMPDRIDIRDWFYQPTLTPLPHMVVNCDRVPLILDQGREGACTGYALAAVVNYHLRQRTDGDAEDPDFPVSPRMLYELARRYDEWPGEDYQGSSARGAMKAWVRHGVCRDTAWPAQWKGADKFTDGIAQQALRAPGGAFYRVMHRQIRDMHAALTESGILYATLMVHRAGSSPDRSARPSPTSPAAPSARATSPSSSARGAPTAATP